MNKMTMHVAVACFLTLFMVAANAQGKSSVAERKYQLSDRGLLVLSVPTGWREQVRTPDAKMSPTINFTAASGQAFSVIVTPLWPMKKDSPAPTLEELKNGVARAAEELKEQAVEKSFDVVQLKGPAARGYYVKATDRAPKAGEYKYMTQGMVALGNVRVTLTVLTNDGQSAIVSAALDMLRGSRLLPTAKPQ
jgi:hypothetical protein